MSVNWTDKDLGVVSAYGVAKEHGWTGTEAEWEALQANAPAMGLKAEGYAVGKQNGEDAGEGETYYHDNAKWYKEQAAGSATAAAGSATSAAASAADALEHTQTTIETWLGNNIDPDSGYALDRTLTSSLAATPADITGDLKSALAYRDVSIILGTSSGDTPIQSITKSGNNVTVSFSKNLLLCFRTKDNKLKYQFIMIANQSYTLNNSYCLVYDVTNDSISTSVLGTSGTSIDSDTLVLITNMYGRVYSPYNGLNDYLQLYAENEPEPTVTTITVTDDNTFCKIRSTILNITDASEAKRYIVFVKNGTYEEIDIITKDYVDIIGESKDGVVINCNGKSTELIPADYSFPAYVGQQISTVSNSYKHLLWHASNSTVKNLTMTANNVKYIVHQDTAGEFTAIVESCNLIREDVYTEHPHNIVGIGSRANQTHIYRNCDFIKRIINYPVNWMIDPFIVFAVYYHNTANQSAPSECIIEDCSVYGCHILYADENASKQDDKIKLINVSTDMDWYGIRYGTANSSNPYNLSVEIGGGKPNFVYCDPYRPKGYLYANSGDIMSVFTSSENVLCGQPIAMPSLLNMGKPVGIASSGDFGFALTDSTSGTILYVNTGKVGNGLMDAGTYVQKTPVYINNGKFTTTENGNVVGYVYKNTTLSATGLVAIIKA